MQRAGRGRRGKSFLSPLGNIYLSVCWLTKRSPAELGALSLAMGVAVAETLETVGVEVALKWPNDILFRDKKMAGILVETEKRDEAWMVVVGVGINVLLTPSHQESDRWTNVSQATRRVVDRNRLAGELISRILVGLDLFDRKGFSAFRARWNARHAMAGKRVRLTSEDHSTEGIALDVDETGAFRLEIAGTTRSFVTGALSLRLI